MSEMIFVSPDAAARTRVSIRVWNMSVRRKSEKTETSHRAERTVKDFLAEGVNEFNEKCGAESTILNPKERLSKNKLMKGISFGLKKACPQKSGCVRKSNAAAHAAI